MLERLRHLGPELFKFLVVGGICFVVDTALSYSFRFEAGLGPNTAKSLATVVATVLSYLLNRLWSLAHRVDAERGHRRDIVSYGVISIVGLVITWIPISVTYYLLGLHGKLAYLVAIVVGTAITTVFRYWAFRRWVFVNDPDNAERNALV
ncbi:MAG: sugar translocase [Frankiales bacterium]|nr:sugar translocase [Frankiales bacterium]